MIGQHLLFRCKKGYYDSSFAAGLKTAAVSRSFASLPIDYQYELNGEINQYAAIPDTVPVSKGKVNRGILRISYFDDVQIVSRIFRVTDRCDNRGSVCFTHTYIFTDEDRDDILKRPDYLIPLSSYDNYANVDVRCGGIANGKTITTDDSLRMPDKSLAIHNEDIFKNYGMNKEIFSKMVSSLCEALSGGDSVAFILPNVNKSTWNDEGGSKIGEKFLAALIRILPPCMARFFSGISYWNENLDFYGLEDIKVLVISEEQYSEVERYGIESFNMISGKANTDCDGGIFGDYLWEIRNDGHKLNEFHQFIETMFGENVDYVAKIPKVMNAITEMYLCPNADTFAIQAVFADLLELFGKNIQLFPNIHQYCNKGINYICQNKTQLSRILEKSLVPYLKQKSDLSKTDENIIKCFMNNIYLGYASEETVLYIKDLIISNQISYVNEFFTNNLEVVESQSTKKLSDSMYQLLTEYFKDKDSSTKLFKRIYDILLTDSENCFQDNEYDKILNIYSTILLSDKLADVYKGSEICDIYSNLYRNILFIAHNNNQTHKRMIDIIYVHFRKMTEMLHNDTLLISNFYKVFFSDIDKLDFDFMKIDGYFKTFILTSPYLDGEMTDLWKDRYLNILRLDYHKYSQSDQFILEFESKEHHILYGLFYNELVRVIYNHHLDWNKIYFILSSYFNNYKDVCLWIIQELTKEIDNTQQILKELRKTEYIYEYYFYILETEEIDNKNIIINQLEQNIIDNDDCMEKLRTSVVNKKKMNKKRVKILTKVYYRIWAKKYNPYYSISDETVDFIWLEESQIKNMPYKDEVMSDFGQAFNDEMKKKVQDMSDKVVQIISYGIREYGWDKKNGWSADKIEQIIFREKIDSDLNDENIRYLLEHCGRNSLVNDLKGYINRVIGAFDKNKVFEKVAFLGILLLFSDNASGYCGRYLTLIGVADKHGNNADWRTAEYIMYGLKYIILSNAMGMKFDNKKQYTDSFVAKFEPLIKTDGKNFILHCQTVYAQDVKPGLLITDTQKFAKKAKQTKDEDLMEMFPMEKTPANLIQKLNPINLFGKKS